MDSSSAHHVQQSGANRLLLIDGNAVLHRAYHALPPLTAPDGSVVNAVYGFASVLIKLFKDLKPTYMAVAFDRPEPTFRKKLFKGYQVQRPEMEKAMVSQIPKVRDMIKAFGIPIYDAAGFEADDVLATLARQAHDEHMIKEPEKHMMSRVHHVPQSRVNHIDEVIIVTGDRDLLQLVGGRVKVFMPTKGLSEGKVYGEADVVERMGVKPDKIPDFKALAGDQSDNYPGVVGIGPKTAANLVNTFGSVEKLYKALEKDRNKQTQKVSDLIKTKLLEGKNSAVLSKDLATIRTNAPVDALPLEPLESLDTPRSRRAFEEFGFKTLLRRLTGEVDLKLKEKPVVKKPEKKQADQMGLFSTNKYVK